MAAGDNSFVEVGAHRIVIGRKVSSEEQVSIEYYCKEKSEEEILEELVLHLDGLTTNVDGLESRHFPRRGHERVKWIDRKSHRTISAIPSGISNLLRGQEPLNDFVQRAADRG